MHSFRTLPAVAVVLLALAAAGPATAATVTLGAAGDTYITEHPGLGGPDSTHATDASLFAMYANGGNPGFRSFPLLQFDLSAYSGRKVTGDATLSLHVQGTDFPCCAAVPRPVSVHPALVPWAPATVTFNTFGASPDVQFGSDVGAALDTIQIDYDTAADNRYVSWILPGSLIQSWIDDPANNRGLLVFNQIEPNFQDLQFGSLESVNPPRLAFDVPEPQTLALTLLALGATRVARRSRPR